MDVRSVFVILTSALMGLIFGTAMKKSNVFIPSVIRDQFSFRDYTMMMMFLAASATSALVLNVLQLIPETRWKEEKAEKEYEARHSNRGFLAVMLGGLLLGAGMQIAGSCPGTVWVQAWAVEARLVSERLCAAERAWGLFVAR